MKTMPNSYSQRELAEQHHFDTRVETAIVQAGPGIEAITQEYSRSMPDKRVTTLRFTWDRDRPIELIEEIEEFAARLRAKLVDQRLETWP